MYKVPTRLPKFPLYVKLSHCQLLSCQQRQYSSWPICCMQYYVEGWVRVYLQNMAKTAV